MTTNETARPEPTLDAFKAWARANRAAAAEVIGARIYARTERERVNAYVLPLLAEHALRDDRGAVITNLDRTYLCDDEPAVAAFFAACDEAHRAHGFTGAAGECPALIAEHNVITAENALIAAAEPLFAVPAWRLTLEKRAEYLRLLLGACAK